MPSRIEVLYFDDCPHYVAVAQRVRALLDREGVAAEVELRRVEDDEDARAAGFLGSPTVRINGRDVEPGAGSRDDFGMKCRLYPAPKGVQPVPPEEWIVDALKRAL